MFKALEAEGRRIVEIAGSSGGALIGALYACGMDVKDIETWATQSEWWKYVTWGGFHGGLVDLKHFLLHLDGMLYGQRLGDLSIDLKVMACDLLTQTSVVLDRVTAPEMKIVDAVAASIAIPVMFTPVKYNGMLLSDGAIMNTLPANQLTRPDTDKLAVRITYPEPFRSHIFSIAKRALYMVIDRGNVWAVRHYCDTEGVELVDVDTGFVDGLNFLMTQETRQRLVDVGEFAVKTRA